MSRILVISPNPPELLGTQKIEAAHFRAWQFITSLVAAEHMICLCSDNDDGLAPIPAGWQNKVTRYPINFEETGWRRTLQTIHDQFQPDGIVAVNFSHALYATTLNTTTPCWFDIYGDTVTIMQGFNYRKQSNRGLSTTISFMHTVLTCGDRFSVCGTPQKHMLVGELAMAGRLNKDTFGYEFGESILPAAPSIVATSVRQQRTREQFNLLGITPKDFVILWAGGYNTWTDVNTLFRGVAAAMAENPTIHYVSVGANTYQAEDNVYDQLKDLAAASSFAERFHFLGWRPYEEMLNYYLESDLGINIDALHYETIYGTRTRLVEMIAARLPTITTRGSELSHLLEAAGATVGFNVGDSHQLGQALIELASNKERTSHIATCAAEYAQSTLSVATTTDALQQWAIMPTHAPDNRLQRANGRFSEQKHQLRAHIRLMLWHLFGKSK